jgi:hypothetical protein
MNRCCRKDGIMLLDPRSEKKGGGENEHVSSS